MAKSGEEIRSAKLVLEQKILKQIIHFERMYGVSVSVQGKVDDGYGTIDARKEKRVTVQVII